MLDKVKVTITREDGSPICGQAPEANTAFLTDDTRFFVARKDRETVETWSVDASGLLELTLAALNKLDAAAQKAICDGYGITIH